MKKLFKNRGNILFVTVIYFTVILLGFALSTLVASYTQTHQKQLNGLYDVYNYESCSKIIATELLDTLDAIEVTLFYSPLLSSGEAQTKLQVSLRNTFIDSAGYWSYSELLPTELNYTGSDYTVKFNDYSISINEDLNIITDVLEKQKDIRISIVWKQYTYTVNISGLCLHYYTTNGLIHCSFDTSKASLAGGQLKCL